jgi:hypothetical protein
MPIETATRSVGPADVQEYPWSGPEGLPDYDLQTIETRQGRLIQQISERVRELQSLAISPERRDELKDEIGRQNATHVFYGRRIAEVRSKTPRLGSFGFWRTCAEEFRQLDPAGSLSLYWTYSGASREYTFGVQNEGPENLGADEFDALASRAGRGLCPPLHSSPLSSLLTELLKVSQEPTVGCVSSGDPVFAGVVPGVCLKLADLCSRLEQQTRRPVSPVSRIPPPGPRISGIEKPQFESPRAEPAAVPSASGKWAALLGQVLERYRKPGATAESALTEWLASEGKGLSRTQVTDYCAGRIKNRVSKEKCAAIENAVQASARKLGLNSD